MPEIDWSQLDEFFLYFLIYSFIGWFWEVSISLVRDHRFVNRGFLNGPYCPIYGCGALLFLWFNSFVGDPVLSFFAGGLMACILEYITSFVMEKLFHARWWDYSKRPFNINGRVCLLGYIVFGAGAVLIRYMHPGIQSFVESIPGREHLASLLGILFLTDIMSTSQSFAKCSKILDQYQENIKNGKVIQFVELKGRKIITTITKQPKRIFTYQQRRIMRAFPALKDAHSRAYNEIQKIYKKTKISKKPKKQLK